MERRMKDCIYYINMGSKPEWIVRQMELTEGEAAELAIKIGSFMDCLQIEANRYERLKRYI